MRESTKKTWIREKLMGKRILALYQSIATLSCAVGAVKCIEGDEDEEGLCRNVNRSVDNDALNYRASLLPTVACVSSCVLGPYKTSN